LNPRTETRNVDPGANFDEERQMAYSYGDNDYGHPYDKNYRPNWHPFATATADLRPLNQQSTDIRWKKSSG